MEAQAVLQDRVGQLRRRIRLLVTVRWVALALTGAALACSLLVLLDRLEVVSVPPERLAALLFLGALAGAGLGLTRPVSLMDAAQLADQRLGLKERLSSGIDFLQRGADDPMIAAQLADAAEHSRRIQPRDVFPFRVPREAKLSLASLLLFLALLFVPEWSVFQSSQVKADKAAIQQAGDRIERLAKQYQKRTVPRNAEIAQRIAANMRALGQEMKRGRVGKKQAMLRMGRLSKEMRDAQRQMAMANTPRTLDQAAQDLKKAAGLAQQRGATAAGAKMMADMAHALDNKDYQAAAQLLQQLAGKLQNGQMKLEEAKAAAESLAKMAAAMKGTSLDAAAKQMEQAGKQLAAAAKMSSAPMQQAMRLAMRQAGQSCNQAGGT